MISAAELKNYARGREIDLLVDVGGLPRELADGRHHPCPKACSPHSGGKDRFRVANNGAGDCFCYCSVCFSHKNGDILAGIQWLRGWSLAEAIERCAERLGVSANGSKRVVHPSRTPAVCDSGVAEAVIERAPPETLDAANRAMLGKFDLSDRHRNVLLEKGLTLETTERGMYRTLGNAGVQLRATIAAQLAVGREAYERIPGIYARRLTAAAGMLIPVRDVAGRIVALRVRHDDCGQRGKYAWISDKKTGPSSGTPCHVPPGVVGPCEVVRCTEGEIKSHVAFLRSGTPTIGVSGVNLWPHFIPALRALSAKKVLLAFDSDFQTNLGVVRQLKAAAEGLVKEGFTVEVETWPPEQGKGIDDLFLAGGKPTVLAIDVTIKLLDECIAKLEAKTAQAKKAATAELQTAALAAIALDGGEVDGDGDDNGETPDGVAPMLASLIQKKHWFAQNEGGKLFHYSGGVYRAKAEESVRRMVKKLLLELKGTKDWSPKLANDVVEYIRVDSPNLLERPPLGIVNVKNGLLRVKDRTLLPHSPTHLSSIQLPVEFVPAAKCPAIDAFVEQVFPPDAATLAYEIPAFLMQPNTSIQKAVLAIGTGGNGKSTYLAMIEAFLGRQNTSNLSLHKLEADRFAASRLYGKLANICPDLPGEHLAGTSVFKAITGGDAITGEYKFRDSFDFIPFARLVFSANSAPRSEDSSPGFFDRWLVIPFDRGFRGTSEEISRTELDARLSAPSELSGLLNRALDVTADLERRNGFAVTASTQAAWQEFHATTDPLAIWLDHFTIDDASAIVPMRSLRIAFNSAMERQGRSPLSKTAFGLAIKKLRPAVISKQRMVSKELTWCYVGIGMSAGEFEDSQTSQTSRSFPLLVTRRREERQEEEVENGGSGNMEQDRGNSVNCVNSVDQTVACDHLDPNAWIRRDDGKAYCPGCNRPQGRYRVAPAAESAGETTAE